MSKKTGAFHIYTTPTEKDGKWIVTKTYLGEVGATYYGTTKGELDIKLKKLLLFSMSISEEYTYEVEHEGQFLYLTHPFLEKESGTYSYSIKKMSNKETIKFYDNFPTLAEAIQHQRKLCNIELPASPKKKVAVRKKPVKKKIRPKKDLPINYIHQQEAYVMIKDLILQGYSRTEVRERLSEIYPELKEQEIDRLFNGAQTFYSNTVVDTLDLPNIIQAHIEHYESIYKYFFECGNTPGMNRAMLLKEKLLGYHKKETILEFNQENNYNVTKPEEYHISVLNVDEQNRLNNYLSRIVVNESN